MKICCVIVSLLLLASCTAIRADYNGMVVTYTRLGSRNIKAIEFAADATGMKAKVKGVEDSEGLSQNLENLVRLLDAVK